MDKFRSDVSPLLKPYMWVNGFEEEDVREFYDHFLELESNPAMPVIYIYIDTYGGPVSGFFAMRDLIKSSSKPVLTACVGKAMSSGACLLACGTPGMRFAAPDSEIMIHEISGMSYGKNQEIQSSSKQADKINRKLITTLALDAKRDFKAFYEQLHKLKNADWFLGTAEAKAWGIIDHAMIPRFALIEQQTILQVPNGYKKAKSTPKSTPQSTSKKTPKKTQKPTKVRK